MRRKICLFCAVVILASGCKNEPETVRSEKNNNETSAEQMSREIFAMDTYMTVTPPFPQIDHEYKIIWTENTVTTKQVFTVFFCSKIERSSRL